MYTGVSCGSCNIMQWLPSDTWWYACVCIKKKQRTKLAMISLESQSDAEIPSDWNTSRRRRTFIRTWLVHLWAESRRCRLMAMSKERVTLATTGWYRVTMISGSETTRFSWDTLILIRKYIFSLTQLWDQYPFVRINKTSTLFTHRGEKFLLKFYLLNYTIDYMNTLLNINCFSHRFIE